MRSTTLNAEGTTTVNHETNQDIGDPGRAATISRRGALRGGMVLAASAATTVGVVSPASAAVSRSRIGYGYHVPTHLRTGYDGNGVGVHGGETPFTYDDGFYVTCAEWADTYGSVLAYMTAGAVTSAWFGCIGVTVSKPGNHGAGKAFDCSASYHTDGGFVDCNTAHLPGAGVVANRNYAGLAWSGRKHMPEVGIVGTDSSHSNHIHFGAVKNGSTAVQLDTGPWDAWLVQYSCQAFMGVPIAVDGQWGAQTQGYFDELLGRLGMAGRNPFASATDLQDLAHTLTAKGLVGQPV
jgi:hypothetical protein